MDKKPFKDLYFNAYCRSCKFETKDEKDSPCEDCLNEPIQSYSNKPVYWVNKDGINKNGRN